MSDSFDVIVVGAGPVGSMAARKCARSGLSTLLIEEQAHVGYPVQCAGLLSKSAFSICEVSDKSILNSVSGATIKSDANSDTNSFSFDAGRTMAYVVDRAALDFEMANHAVDKGAEIYIKTRADSVSVKNHTIIAKGIRGTEEIKYKILIAADGPRSIIARNAGLGRAPLYLSGLQCDIPYKGITDKVTIFPNSAPDFFAWIIPTGPARARAGLCGINNVKDQFGKFISNFSTGSVQFTAGTIPLGVLKKTYANGLMVAGDAAAQAKPTSGGGVYTGVKSARYAAKVAADACEADNYSASFLSAYEKAWKTDIGSELSIGMRALRIRRQINQIQMDKLITLLNNPEIKDQIVSKGDIDRPSTLIKSLIKNPKMLSAIGIAGPAVIKSFLKK